MWISTLDGAGITLAEEKLAATPAVNLRVLDSVEVKFPDHTVTYQRVAPPRPLPQKPLAPLPEAQPLSYSNTARIPTPTLTATA